MSWTITPLPLAVPENKRNPNLANELFKQGAEGLLRRAVEGCERVLQREGFSYPEPVRVAAIEITQIQLQDVKPPGPVIDSFDDVNRAQQDQERLSNEADAYRNDVLPREVKDALIPLGFSDMKSSSMYWIGVRFRDEG